MRHDEAKMQRMIVQMLWTLGVFCGTPAKTGPEAKVIWQVNKTAGFADLRFAPFRLIRVNPRKSAARVLVRKKMRSGPATQTAFVRGFLLAFVTAWRRPLVEASLAKERPLQPDSARVLSNDECRFCQSRLPLAISQSLDLAIESSRLEDLAIKRSLDKKISRSQIRNRCGCQLTIPAPQSGTGGGRNAQAPGSRLRAFRMSPGDSPSRITGCRWLSPQSFGEFRNAHVLMNPLSATMSRPATQKPSPLVKKLWTMRLPCGIPWKSKN